MKEIINLPVTEREPRDDYLKKLEGKNVNKDDLINKLDTAIKSNNYKIIYVASFIEGINKNTNSTYIKFLIEQCKKNLDDYQLYIY